MGLKIFCVAPDPGNNSGRRLAADRCWRLRGAAGRVLPGSFVWRRPYSGGLPIRHPVRGVDKVRSELFPVGLGLMMVSGQVLGVLTINCMICIDYTKVSGMLKEIGL